MQEYLSGIKQFIEKHPVIIIVFFISITIVAALLLRAARFGSPARQATPGAAPFVPLLSDQLDEAETADVTAQIVGSACFRGAQCTSLRYYFFRRRDGNIDYIATRSDVTKKGTTPEYVLQRGHLKSTNEISQVVSAVKEFVNTGRSAQFVYYLVGKQIGTEWSFQQALALK